MIPLRVNCIVGNFSVLFDSKSRRDFYEDEDDECHNDEGDEFLNKHCRGKGH